MAGASVKKRFGKFEVDPRAGEVYRDGSKLKLQGQPVQVLLVLIESPGELVSREELHSRLWTKDTFVDFDNGLNTAIKKLRVALGDNTDQPRFIETLPRRGYRFIAPVEEVPGPASPARSSDRSDHLYTPPDASTRSRKLAVASALLLLIALPALLGILRHSASASHPKFNSIAVLPLENYSGDSRQEYLVDGMTDALITDLARLGSLRVISRTSVMYYKGKHKPLKQILEQLKVDAVVEGSVSRDGDGVRITARLIDAHTEQHLWAASYHREFRDVLLLQDQVAADIAERVQANLTPEQKAHLHSSRPLDPQAYEAYLQGWYFWNKFNPDYHLKAVEYFTEAIQREPSFAPAWAGLAESYLMQAVYGGAPALEVTPKGIAAARKALELDSKLAEAHYSMALAKAFYEYDWDAAGREFEIALRLDPNYSIGRMWHAAYFTALGRHSEAIAEQERARELDPLSLIVNVNLARAYYFARNYPRALVWCKKALELDPTFGLGYGWCSKAYEQQGLYRKAIAEIEIPLRQQGLGKLADDMDAAYKRSGYQGWLLARLKFALAHKDESEELATNVTEAYARLQDRAQTLKWLELGYDKRYGYTATIKVRPEFDFLRSDPRYLQLLHKMHLQG